MRSGHEALCSKFVVAAMEGKNADYTVHIVEGDPRHSTLKMVEQLKPAMVVVGSHGKGFIARTMLGSVSSWLATHSTVPVLIARQ